MKPTLNWLEDPEVFAVNREKAHSDHDCTVKGKALRQSLNGTWKFCFSERPEERPAEFYREDFDAADFDEIPVPAHIQLQGYDSPQYVNTQYPWEGKEKLLPPQIPKKRNPVGSYVKYFDADEELLGKETYISFQGVETAFYVWLNGEFVGLFKVIGAVVNAAGGNCTQPVQILVDGINVLGVFLGGVSIVITEIEQTAVFLCGAVVDIDCLSGANVQISVGLGRETGVNGIVHACSEIFINNLVNKIACNFFHVRILLIRHSIKELRSAHSDGRSLYRIR